MAILPLKAPALSFAPQAIGLFLVDRRDLGHPIDRPDSPPASITALAC